MTQRKTNLFPQGSKIVTSRLKTRNQNALSQVCVTTSDSAQHIAEKSVFSNREHGCYCTCVTQASLGKGIQLQLCFEGLTLCEEL